MNSRLIRLLVMFLAALLLPVQGVVAATMPVCGHGPAAAMAEMAAMDADCPMMRDAASAADTQPGGCHQCGICHLATGGCVPMANLSCSLVAFAETFFAAPVHRPASVDPEPPTQPPRRTA